MTSLMKINPDLPFVNLEAIHKLKNLPGYVHRVVLDVQEKRWFMTKDFFTEGYLSDMEMSTLLQSCGFIRGFFSSESFSEQQSNIAGMIMIQLEPLCEALSAGEGDFYNDANIKKSRLFNLLKMSAFVQMQMTSLGKCNYEKFSINSSNPEEMFTFFGDNGPSPEKVDQ